MKKNSARLGTKRTKPRKKAKVESLPAEYQVQTLFKPSIQRTYYDTDFHPEDFIAHCREGSTPNMIAAYWGIAKSTLDTWVRKHIKFKKAYLVGATAYRAFWETKLTQYAKGEISWRDFNIHAFDLLSRATMRWGRDEGTEAFDAAAESPYQLIDVSTGKMTDENLNPVDTNEDVDL